jgi:hypothetical protein
MEGKEATVPMLHVKYRASQSVNRKYEMTVRDWATGTNRKDVRETEFLTEKALMVSGRNNLVIYKG